MKKYDVGCNINTNVEDFKKCLKLVDLKKLVMQSLRDQNLMNEYNKWFYYKNEAEKHLKDKFKNFKYKKYLSVDEFITL